MARQPPSAMEILDGISSETAQQMFTAIRYHTDSTMIPQLDEYILKAINTLPSRQSSLNSDIIEVQGPAASGKTQLLYHLAAICILPSAALVTSQGTPSGGSVFIGGWHKSVVILDCDGRWDLRRLHQILITRLNRAFSRSALLPHKPKFDATSIALNCLSRLHLFRPTSSLQLAATLLNLPTYHKEQMPQEEIRLLLIDSVSSFYWGDRWQVELSGMKKLSQSNPLTHVLRNLQAFMLSHGPVTILTNWALNSLPSVMPSSSSDSSTPFFKQHLPCPFPSPFEESLRPSLPGDPTVSLACHITLSFSLVPPLPFSLKHPDETGTARLRQAISDDKRKELVEKIGIRAHVRDPWLGNIQDTALRDGLGKFKIQILEQDVVTTSA